MSRGFPSLTAFLGLLAIAGYQNRDKIADMLRGLEKKPGSAQSQGGIGGVLDQLRTSLGGRSEEHTSELQSHGYISHAVFCLKTKTKEDYGRDNHPRCFTGWLEGCRSEE